MTHSIKDHVERPPVFIKEAVNEKFKKIPDDVLLAVAFFYNDFTSLRSQNMMFCAIQLDVMDESFQEFNVEGMAIPEKRRPLYMCALEVLKIARDIIDKKVSNYPDAVECIKQQRADVIRRMVGLRDYTIENEIDLGENPLFVGFTINDYNAILDEFAPLFVANTQ